MGFPVGYTDLLLPNLFLHTLSLLGYLRKFLSALFRFLGFRDFLEPDISFSQPDCFVHDSEIGVGISGVGFGSGPIGTEMSVLGSDTMEPEPETMGEQALDSESESVSSVLIREFLTVAKFSDLVHPPESCAVCLYEFEFDDEIRPLTNCRHIFHKGCLDRWMCYDQKTCPLCRTPFIPPDLLCGSDERPSETAESYGDSSLTPTGL